MLEKWNIEFSRVLVSDIKTIYYNKLYSSFSEYYLISGDL